jgi:hypothetical protein
MTSGKTDDPQESTGLATDEQLRSRRSSRGSFGGSGRGRRGRASRLSGGAHDERPTSGVVSEEDVDFDFAEFYNIPRRDPEPPSQIRAVFSAIKSRSAVIITPLVNGVRNRFARLTKACSRNPAAAVAFVALSGIALYANIKCARSLRPTRGAWALIAAQQALITYTAASSFTMCTTSRWLHQPSVDELFPRSSGTS